MKKLKCTRCGFTCTSEIEMRRHVEYRHADPVSSSPSYSNQSDTSSSYSDPAPRGWSESNNSGGGDFGGGGSSSSWDSGSSDSGSSSSSGD